MYSCKNITYEFGILSRKINFKKALTFSSNKSIMYIVDINIRKFLICVGALTEGANIPQTLVECRLSTKRMSVGNDSAY